MAWSRRPDLSRRSQRARVVAVRQHRPSAVVYAVHAAGETRASRLHAPSERLSPHRFDQQGQAIADYTRAIDSGELSRAQSRFRPQAAPYDHLAIAHHNRGWVYSQKSLYDQAIADYTRALKLQPDYISAYKLRGNAYDGKGLREQAKADREKARQLEAR